MARPGENAINCDCDVGVCDIITFCHDCHYPHRLRSAGSGRFSLSPSSPSLAPAPFCTFLVRFASHQTGRTPINYAEQHMSLPDLES